jgi:hypothetical protein
MRKSIVVVVLLCFFTLVASVANAKPASNLTRVEILQVGADQTGWIPANEANRTTLYGENFYVAVHFTGYPLQNSIFIFQNGTQIPTDQIAEPFSRIGIGNPAVGWIYQFKIPIAYGNGAICIKASSINSGGTYYDTVSNITSVYQK